MKITISGHVGSGKSTVARKVAEEMKYNYYSVGQFMREIAKKRGLTINDLSKKAEGDFTIDEELDEMQKSKAKEEDFVMDSRLGFHFIPDSFKVFLSVDISVAADRITKDERDEEKYANREEAVEYLKRRMLSEKGRYKEYYGIDFPDDKMFDLMIDTTDKNVEEVVGEIIKNIPNKSMCIADNS